MSPKIFRIVGAVLATGTLLAAGIILPSEFRAADAAKRSPMSWFLTTSPIDLPVSTSIEGKYAVITGCHRALSNTIARIMPTKSKNAVADQCLTAMDGILVTTPNMAAAHLIRANTLAMLGQKDQAIDALLLSEQWGRGLRWMAKSRIDIAFALAAHIDNTQVQQMISRDVARLIKQGGDPDALASTLVHFPKYRDDIIGWVERRPAVDQRSFLSAMRRQGR